MLSLNVCGKLKPMARKVLSLIKSTKVFLGFLQPSPNFSSQPSPGAPQSILTQELVIFDLSSNTLGSNNSSGQNPFGCDVNLIEVECGVPGESALTQDAPLDSIPAASC